VSDTAKMRKPDFASKVTEPSGRVTRDAKGNAVWKWAGNADELPAALIDAGLSVTGEAPPAAATSKVPTTLAKSGYDPYQSGRVEKTADPKKRASRKPPFLGQARKRSKDDAGN
jgi:hypothetical protein